MIGDNYEAETLFLVTGFQYISSAMAYNFGYEFRQGWFRNYVFVFFATFFALLHFYVTLTETHVSCIFRVNCINENVVESVTLAPLPIENPFNTTVMPKYYRQHLVLVMIINAILIAAWDFFVVNGIRRRMAARKRQKVMGNGPNAGQMETLVTKADGLTEKTEIV